LARIEWTAEAEERLKEIHDYVAQDKPEAAFRLVASTYRRVEILASSGLRCPPRYPAREGQRE